MAWTATYTWVNAGVPTAAKMNEQGRDNLTYLYDRLGTLPSGNSDEVGGARALATAYQNTNTLSAEATVYCHLLVHVSVQKTTAGNLDVTGTIGAGNPPGTVVAYAAYKPIPATAARIGIAFLVNPGYYYQVDSTGGTIYKWTEAKLA